MEDKITGKSLKQKQETQKQENICKSWLPGYFIPERSGKAIFPEKCVYLNESDWF